MSSTELFRKHFGEESATVDLKHPNMEAFFKELNQECLEEDKIVTEIPVRTDRSDQFRNFIQSLGDVLNVVEIVSPARLDGHGCLRFIIACIPENEKQIIDYGFMSFINNPEFQKYYES